MWRPLRPTPPPSKQWIDFAPSTPLAEGIARLVDGSRNCYQVGKESYRLMKVTVIGTG